jgi:uncharacterized damage-inducible protein DinB
MNKDLISESLEILIQAKKIISELNGSQFVFINSSLFLSSAGQHFRHVLDFYTAFAGGYKTEEIDYDKRERNEQVAEKRGVCIKKIDEIVSFLNSIRDIDMSSVLIVSTIEGTTGLSSSARSTIGRELQFMLSHTIHHYALISIILKSQGVDIPKNFGIARSTIEYYNY